MKAKCKWCNSTHPIKSQNRVWCWRDGVDLAGLKVASGRRDETAELLSEQPGAGRSQADPYVLCLSGRRICLQSQETRPLRLRRLLDARHALRTYTTHSSSPGPATSTPTGASPSCSRSIT